MCEIQILILFDQSVYSYMTRKSRIWCIQKHVLTPPTLLRLSALASASAPSRTEVAEKHAYRHLLKKRVRYSKQTLRSTVRYARRRAALPQPLCAHPHHPPLRRREPLPLRPAGPRIAVRPPRPGPRALHLHRGPSAAPATAPRLRCADAIEKKGRRR